MTIFVLKMLNGKKLELVDTTTSEYAFWAVSVKIVVSKL
jgi:hypothetical protein